MHLADLTSYCKAQERLGALYATRRMGAQSDPERGQLREVFERPLDCGIRKRDLEGGTMPSSLETQSRHK
jgi:hypothetical protein